MKRVLVTGAGGFVGANLARRLLSEGHEVHVLTAHRSWRLDEIADHIKIHTVDLTDASAVSKTISTTRPDWVFHLAAHGAYCNQTDLLRMVQTNIFGTMNLVEACLEIGFEAFVNTGSSSEYGYKDHPPAEGECLAPNSHYAVTKASATLYCRHTAESRNVHLPTLRLYSVYGPYEEPNRLIPTLVVHGLRGELPPLVNPDVARDFVYVDDVCDAYLLAATHITPERGAIYNVGTGMQTRLRDVVATGRDLFAIDKLPEWGSMPNRRWDTEVWVADNRKIMAELGWQPKVNFADGLRMTSEWLKNHPDLRQRYTDTIG